MRLGDGDSLSCCIRTLCFYLLIQFPVTPFDEDGELTFMAHTYSAGFCEYSPSMVPPKWGPYTAWFEWAGAKNEMADLGFPFRIYPILDLNSSFFP